MRWRASCSSIQIFRECGDLPIAGSWLIFFSVDMGFRFVLGIGMFGKLVLGIGMSGRFVSAIGMVRRFNLRSLLFVRK